MSEKGQAIKAVEPPKKVDVTLLAKWRQLRSELMLLEHELQFKRADFELDVVRELHRLQVDPRSEVDEETGEIRPRRK